MGLFDFFKKKPQPKPQATEERNAAELAESKAYYDELGCKHIRNLAAIDWDAMVPGNMPVSLSAEEIDFLGAVDGVKIHDTRIAKRWTEIGVDFDRALRKLFSMGLVDWACLDDTLVRMKVSELKEVLAGHGMPTSGKKDALIQRILTIDRQLLRSQIPPTSISLTDTGRKIVAKKQKQDRDRDYQQASKESSVHLKEGNLSAYCVDLTAQVRVLMAEQNYEAALELTFLHFVVAATGISDIRLVEVYRADANMKGMFEPVAFLAPHLIDTTLRCMDELSLDVGDLEGRYRAVIQDDQIPCGVFTADEGWEMLVMALDDLGAAENMAEMHGRRFVLREGL